VIFYPDGYGTRMVTLEEMEVRHGGKQHPEFARRFFAYMEHKGGALGVGGGWRSTQPDKPGFAPDGKSFHQDQRYASGFVGYAAVDLVHVNPGGKHRSPTWDECADAPTFGLHTFITGEPWHIQCVEMRGWQTWVNAGRPDPQTFTLPGTPPPVITPPTTDEVEMIALDHNPGTPEWTALSWTGVELAHVFNGHADSVLRRANVPRQTITDSELDGIIASSTTKTACPVAWAGTPRGVVWDAQRG